MCAENWFLWWTDAVLSIRSRMVANPDVEFLVFPRKNQTKSPNELHFVI